MRERGSDISSVFSAMIPDEGIEVSVSDTDEHRILVKVIPAFC